MKRLIKIQHQPTKIKVEHTPLFCIYLLSVFNKEKGQEYSHNIIGINIIKNTRNWN